MSKKVSRKKMVTEFRNGDQLVPELSCNPASPDQVISALQFLRIGCTFQVEVVEELVEMPDLSGAQ